VLELHLSERITSSVRFQQITIKLQSLGTVLGAFRMAGAPHSKQSTQLERQILRLLITRQIEAPKWIEIERELGSYPWRESDHAMIYQAILRIRNRGGRNSREALAVETTRMGFPDLNWKPFFQTKPAGSAEPKLEQLLRRLKSTRREG
jgi:hypothetical protein